MTDDRPDPSIEELAERISERGAELRARVDAQADREVQIVAVTKGHPVGVATAAHRAGFLDLGENYAQELRAKADVLGHAGDVHWHFIGRLQSNKVRTLADTVSLWQSVDRSSVLSEIAKRSPAARVLIQVDLAGIPGRGGCARDDVARLLDEARDARLVVDGLMGVGPPGEPELSRPGFRWLRREADSLGLGVVSMGMSADLEVAVQEGSTMVRVGSALVGNRPNDAAPPEKCT